jgi:hypothetical protein
MTEKSPSFVMDKIPGEVQMVGLSKGYLDLVAPKKRDDDRRDVVRP